MQPSPDPALAPLRDVGALLEGHFVLASGKHSGHYVQVARLAEQPAKLGALLEQHRDALAALQPDSVFAPAIGALPIGQQLALTLGCRSKFAERKDNVMTLRRGFAFRPGERLLLVEDVVTTGGTLGEIAALAESQGAEVAGVFAVINRSGEPTWRGKPLHALFSLQFPVHEPSACPLCAEGLPTERPGSKAVDGPKGDPS